MKVIVFGGSGFLGSHVADTLSDAGHAVTIFDLKPSPWLRPDQTMVVGDILDEGVVGEAVAGCDVVYHFAGVADLDDGRTRPLATVVQNVQGTVLLLEAARAAAVHRFVFASSIYVYSSSGGFYRCSKQAAEIYIEEYQSHYGLDFTILRFGTIYGPRADSRNSVYRYLSDALTTRRVVCSGTGDEMREYIHVRDAAHLSVEVLAEEHRNQRVVITGQNRLRFADLLNMVREIFDFKIEIVLEPPAPGSRGHYNLTPYSFTPRVGYKLTSNRSWDLGQGLIECILEISDRNSGSPGNSR